MLYITQLIYIQPGQEDTFNAFEALAIPLISKYNGKLLLRVRPTEQTVIEANTEAPYEIHLVSFPAEQDFEAFMRDEERKNFLHLKEQSIRSTLLIKGDQL
jgi:uncharacterized protein (DUF1330 family)